MEFFKCLLAGIRTAIPFESQRIKLCRLIVQMQLRQCLARIVERIKIIGQGDTRQLLFQVGRKSAAILFRVEDSIDVIEDVLFLDPSLAGVFRFPCGNAIGVGLPEQRQSRFLPDSNRNAGANRSRSLSYVGFDTLIKIMKNR